MLVRVHVGMHLRFTVQISLSKEKKYFKTCLVKRKRLDQLQKPKLIEERALKKQYQNLGK